jgi:hypothetical protein
MDSTVFYYYILLFLIWTRCQPKKSYEEPWMLSESETVLCYQNMDQIYIFIPHIQSLTGILNSSSKTHFLDKQFFFQ